MASRKRVDFVGVRLAIEGHRGAWAGGPKRPCAGRFQGRRGNGRVAHFSGEYTLSREPLAAKMKGVPHFS
ncbi:MAG: hypothetical protein WAL58_18695, partial [Terriglobales bacterium]